ncbi:MAG TPA: universal stress protein, partial [Chitinophagaceae bacterium]|nr:universal stress protein [Chitinophagaceae bacterium]
MPTDFSDTSKNAARYAAQMLDGKDDVQMILYYVYDSFTAGTDGSPLNEDDKDRMVILNQALDNLKAELQTVSRVHIETRTEAGSSLVDNVDRVIRHNKIDMVVMGI